jgi:ATP/maltotriose-dependent transcriptional regulator MalT
MAEPPTTSLPGGAAPAWDVLVATKFHVPPAGFVPRPRLLTRLAQGIGRGLTVVCTPAGFGKTTLLGDWVWGTQTWTQPVSCQFASIMAR